MEIKMRTFGKTTKRAAVVALALLLPHFIAVGIASAECEQISPPATFVLKCGDGGATTGTYPRTLEFEVDWYRGRLPSLRERTDKRAETDCQSNATAKVGLFIYEEMKQVINLIKDRIEKLSSLPAYCASTGIAAADWTFNIDRVVGSWMEMSTNVEPKTCQLDFNFHSQPIDMSAVTNLSVSVANAQQAEAVNTCVAAYISEMDQDLSAALALQAEYAELASKMLGLVDAAHETKSDLGPVVSILDSKSQASECAAVFEAGECAAILGAGECAAILEAGMVLAFQAGAILGVYNGIKWLVARKKRKVAEIKQKLAARANMGNGDSGVDPDGP